MKVVWWDSAKGGRDRVKHIDDDKLAEYVSYGWQEVIQEPGLPPAPITPETPLERLETAVENVGKKQRGRPKKWK
jgi:hypothetical protein